MFRIQPRPDFADAPLIAQVPDLRDSSPGGAERFGDVASINSLKAR